MATKYILAALSLSATTLSAPYLQGVGSAKASIASKLVPEFTWCSE
jgi:hypothetical protein